MMQSGTAGQFAKLQKLYFGLGLLILSLGIYFRLNAHSLAWAHSPINLGNASLPYSGAWQDVMPFGMQETALIEVSRVLMGFGALLSLMALYWWWRFQFVLATLQEENAVNG